MKIDKDDFHNVDREKDVEVWKDRTDRKEGVMAGWGVNCTDEKVNRTCCIAYICTWVNPWTLNSECQYLFSLYCQIASMNAYACLRKGREGMFWSGLKDMLIKKETLPMWRQKAGLKIYVRVYLKNYLLTDHRIYERHESYGSTLWRIPWTSRRWKNTHLCRHGNEYRQPKDIDIYTTAVKLAQILRKDFLSSKLSYRIATYYRFQLMILDEIGYLPLTREESNLFFLFVSSL